MGSMSISSCICCMFVCCVHPVAVLNAEFCMTCSLLMLVVVVRLPRPMEGNGEFSDPYRTASSTTGGWSRWTILMCLIYIYIYPSKHYGLIFGPYGCHIFFYKVSIFCIRFHFCKYTLHLCYVFNVNLADSFDDRRSQCRLI